MSVVINGTTGITSVNGSAAAPSVTGADTDTGIVYGTNTLSLATGGTTAVTVDSSQNVGIGTSSPTAKLTVSSTSSVVTNGASTRNPVASLYGGNSNNRLDMYVDNSGATAIMGLGAYNVAGGTTAMTFYTGASVAEAMRIDTSGNLLVGTTSGSNRLTVSSAVNDYISRMYNTNATGADMLYMQSTADPNNSTYKFIYTYSGAAARFSVSSNGGISNYSANNVNLSDRREDQFCASQVVS